MNAKLNVKKLLAEDGKDVQFDPLSFEDGLTLLEELVEQVEEGELPLEKSILAYERGVGLLGHIRGLISGAEEKLEKLQKGASEKKSRKK